MLDRFKWKLVNTEQVLALLLVNQMVFHYKCLQHQDYFQQH